MNEAQYFLEFMKIGMTVSLIILLLWLILALAFRGKQGNR